MPSRFHIHPAEHTVSQLLETQVGNTRLWQRTAQQIAKSTICIVHPLTPFRELPCFSSQKVIGSIAPAVVIIGVNDGGLIKNNLASYTIVQRPPSGLWQNRYAPADAVACSVMAND